MPATYAVSWQDPGGSLGSGRLELGANALLLTGQTGTVGVELAYPYSQIAGFRVARANGERLQGRPTLIVDLYDSKCLKIAGVAQPGIVSELATRLAALR